MQNRVKKALIPANPARILITGASGELGGALALHYAAPGVMLSLWGRDEVRLAAIASQCREQEAQVQIRSIDLSDVDRAIATAVAEHADSPFDLAIFASGLGDVRAAGQKVEGGALISRLATINFTAPAAMSAALGAHMADRGQGHLVLVGSAAAFHALPFAAAYSGSKAGLARFADALRLSLRPHGVVVTLVSPGFIDTAAGRRTGGTRPFLLQPKAAAARIARAVERRAGHAVFPFPFRVLRLVDRLLPRFLRDRLLLSLE